MPEVEEAEWTVEVLKSQPQVEMAVVAKVVLRPGHRQLQELQTPVEAVVAVAVIQSVPQAVQV